MSILNAQITQAKEREEADRLRTQKAAAARKAARTARETELEQLRQQAEQERRDHAAHEAKVRRIRAAVLQAKSDFTTKLSRKLAHWCSDDLVLADAYAEALIQFYVKDSDLTPPETPERVTRMVNDIFVNCLSRVGDDLPVNAFVGQMQPWFSSLIEKRQSRGPQAVTPKPLPEKLVYTTRTVPSGDELAQPNEAPTVRSEEELVLRDAITQRKPGRKSHKKTLARA